MSEWPINPKHLLVFLFFGLLNLQVGACLQAQSTAEADQLLNKTYDAFLLRDYPLALEYATRAAIIYEKEKDLSDPLFQRALLLQAGSLSRDGERRQEADALFQNIFSSWNHSNPEDISKADTYHLYGTLQLLDGNTEEALANYGRAATFYQKNPLQLNFFYGSNFLNTGFIHFRLGDLAEAEDYYQQALSVWQQHFGDNHQVTAMAYNNIALLRQEQGKLEEAIAFYEKTLSIKTAVYPSAHPEIVTAHNNLAWAYWNLGDFERAKIQFIAAYEMAKKLPKEQIYAVACNNMGLVRQYEQAYEQELAFFQEALSVEKAIKVPEEDQAITLHNIGFAYADLEQDELALSYFLKAVRTGNADDYRKPNLHIGLGNFYLEKGNFPLAEEAFLNALRINQAHFSDPHPISAEAYYALGEVQRNTQHYDQALRYNQSAASALGFQSVDDWSAVSSFLLLYKILHQHGDILQIQAQLAEDQILKKEALFNYQLAIAALEKVRNFQLTPRAKGQISVQIDSMVATTLSLCVDLYQATNDPLYNTIFVNLSERSRGFQQRLNLYYRQLNAAYNIPQDLLQEEGDILINLELLTADCERMEKGLRPPSQRDCNKEKLALILQYSQFLEQLKNTWPEYYQNRQSLPTINEQELLLLLNPDR